MVALGGLIAHVPIVSKAAALEALQMELKGKKAALLQLNLQALETGMAGRLQTE